MEPVRDRQEKLEKRTPGGRLPTPCFHGRKESDFIQPGHMT